MKTERIETFIVLIVFLIVGVFLSNHLDKRRTVPGPGPAINPDIVTVDVVREGDDISIYEHYSGELVFEYNRFKEADKEAWQEYEDLLIEIRGKE
jgi:uncharacterized membrane protein